MVKFDLSVVIPNYNNGKYLVQCVESIVNQSFLPREIIIVDDCSTDDSKMVIQALAQKYSQVIPVYLTKNGGVSKARNRGIAEATSEYITFLDADDYYWNQECLKLEMALIHRYAEKGKDILAYSVFTCVDEEGNMLPGNYNRRWNRFQFVHGKAWVPMVSMTKMNRGPKNYCIKRQLILDAGAFSFYKDFYEDQEILMRIAELGIDFYCTFEFGTAYRSTPGGLSRRKEEEHIQTRKEIQNMYYRKLKFHEKIYCRFLQIRHKIWMEIKLEVLVPIKCFVERRLDR